MESSDLAKAERERAGAGVGERELQRTDRLTGPEEVYNAPLPQATPSRILSLHVATARIV